MFISPVRYQNLAFKCIKCQKSKVEEDQKTEEVDLKEDSKKKLEKAIQEMEKVERALRDCKNVEKINYSPALDFPRLESNGEVHILLRNPNYEVRTYSDEKSITGSITNRDNDEVITSFDFGNRLMSGSLSSIVSGITSTAWNAKNNEILKYRMQRPY